MVRLRDAEVSICYCKLLGTTRFVAVKKREEILTGLLLPIAAKANTSFPWGHYAYMPAGLRGVARTQTRGLEKKPRMLFSVYFRYACALVRFDMFKTIKRNLIARAERTAPRPVGEIVHAYLPLSTELEIVGNNLREKRLDDKRV
jgi:hypothetical protein